MPTLSGHVVWLERRQHAPTLASNEMKDGTHVVGVKDVAVKDDGAHVNTRIESSFDDTFETLGRESTAANGGGDTRDAILALASLTSQIGAVLEALAHGKNIKHDSVAASLNKMFSAFTSLTDLDSEERARATWRSDHSETSPARNNADVPHEVPHVLGGRVSEDPDDNPVCGRTSTASRMSRMLLHWFPLKRTMCKERTLTDVVRGCSTFARVALFCGGHAKFFQSHAQLMYNAIFVSSFTLCLLVCMVNMFVRAPPYNYVWLDALTVYLHVVGLHSWLHWRHHGHDLALTKFVQDMEATTDSWTKNALDCLAWQTQVGCAILLLVQVCLVGVAFLALSQPGFEHWQSGSDDSGSRTYALIHALVMWSVIPQHIPMILSGHVLFFYVIRLHTLDFMRALSLADRIEKRPETSRVPKYQGLACPTKYQEAKVGSTQTDYSVQDEDTVSANIIDRISSIAETAQDRLDMSCEKFSRLWIHQLAYAFCQILFVATYCYPIVSPETRAQAIKDIQASSRFGIFIPILHGALGVSVLLTTLIGPAMTTHHVRLAPLSFLKAMRKLGATATQTEARIAFLDRRLLGFNYYLQTIDTTLVSKFISLVVVCISLAAWGNLRDSNPG